MEKVSPEPNSGCWLWTGAERGSYGLMRHGPRNAGKDSAHRIAYRLFHGDIPDGLHVLHHCDNHFCVNPAHLRAGTPQDNMDDKMKRGRHRVPRGETHPTAKLTAAAASDIRSKTRKCGEYAALYGISKWTVFDIQSGRRWR